MRSQVFVNPAAVPMEFSCHRYATMRAEVG